MPEALDELDPSQSILFLGSGFSKTAQNIRNTNLPIGHELQQIFSNYLGINWNTYDLKTLADEIDSRHDLDLYQILYELFTVKKLQSYNSIFSYYHGDVYTQLTMIMQSNLLLRNTLSKYPVLTTMITNQKKYLTEQLSIYMVLLVAQTKTMSCTN